MSLPFETVTQRALRNVRQLSRRLASLYPSAYENFEGEATAVVGNEAGPYHNALGRASTDGTLGSVVVENGDPQLLLTDEYGRLWTRSAGGATVNLTNFTITASVAGGPIAISAPAGKLYEVLAHNTEASGGLTMYLMIFDALAPVGAPLVASIPFVPSAVGDYDFTAFPITCATGITAAFSSDPYTYVAAAGVGVITIRVL